MSHGVRGVHGRSLVPSEEGGLERSAAEQLERVVKRLDRANVRLRPPPGGVFRTLERIGATGLPVGIGMLVDGALIAGAVQAPVGFGNAVADAANTAMEGFGWREELRSEITAAFRELEPGFAELQEEAEELADRYPDDANIDDIDGPDVFDFYRALMDRATVDLADVRMTLPGRDEAVSLSAMRVQVAHIAAWWPLEAQDGTNVNYVAPSPTSETKTHAEG